MPQLIAMVIVVVGAMIYMFQTFGGTGDKIEGIAQKTSIVTEINNLKNGLKLATRANQLAVPGGVTMGGANENGAVATLTALGDLEYFQTQINDQLAANADLATPIDGYNAISFGGTELNAAGNNDSNVQFFLVNNAAGVAPGIFVRINPTGTLGDNRGFLEMQIANDLADIAGIDRTATLAAHAAVAQAADADGVIPAMPVIPALVQGADANTDGEFTIFFRDFGLAETVLP